ncbi:MAG: hypothetical protein AVDCRST_MAG89-2144, partial [uncultured Gemmatimonadetes bacterium]
ARLRPRRGGPGAGGEGAGGGAAGGAFAAPDRVLQPRA